MRVMSASNDSYSSIQMKGLTTTLVLILKMLMGTTLRLIHTTLTMNTLLEHLTFVVHLGRCRVSCSISMLFGIILLYSYLFSIILYIDHPVNLLSCIVFLCRLLACISCFCYTYLTKVRLLPLAALPSLILSWIE